MEERDAIDSLRVDLKTEKKGGRGPSFSVAISSVGKKRTLYKMKF